MFDHLLCTSEQNEWAVRLAQHTLHILPAIYPNEALSRMEAKTDMKNRNYEAWVSTYEDFYQKPLVYGEV